MIKKRDRRCGAKVSESERHKYRVVAMLKESDFEILDRLTDKYHCTMTDIVVKGIRLQGNEL